MKYDEIAIIGMSGRFPKADSLEMFHYNLENKIDCVGQIPSKRKKLLKLSEDKEYMECGFLDDIEYFDNDFFGIPSKEADFMSPEQRIILELTAEAILNAGYSLENFRGSNCGVFLSSSENEYENLLSKKNAPTRLGSLNSIVSGRVAYQFDLRGPNILYDTGCSSALVALHEACIKLSVKEIDYALVGGISISLDIPKVENLEYDALGLCSKSFRSKSFDKNADGVALGEGGGCILLKSLEKAKKDKDSILAVIKAGAVNGDGGRCSSVTMPSVYGQKDVMKSVWKDVDLINLTDIEAHGIGTSIGDSIEAQSIIEVMKELDANQTVRLGSVKSSIGHLGYSAGISGIVKAVLALKYNVSYPIVHYKEANPLIDFSKSSLEPVTSLVEWESETKRLIGIDSFGLGGTNAHVVIEKYFGNNLQDTDIETKVFKISARSETAFCAYKEKIKDLVSNIDINLNNLLYTLNIGRDDYSYRRMVVVKDREDLLDKLEMMAPNNKKKTKKVILCMKLEEYRDFDWERMNVEFPGIVREEMGISRVTDADYKLKMYRFYTQIGVKADLILADEQCKAIINYYNNKIGENELNQTMLLPMNDDYSKLIQVLQSLNKDEEYLVLDFGSKKILKNANIGKNVKVYEVSSISDFYRFLVSYYNDGNNIDWHKFYGEKKYQKLSLCGYCFDKSEHWAEMKSRVSDDETQKKYDSEYTDELVYQDITENDIQENNKVTDTSYSMQDIVNTLQQIWKNVFGFEGDIEEDEDFFDLGGNSLLIQKMSVEINEKFQIEFDAYEVYENETIEKLSAKIFEYV